MPNEKIKEANKIAHKYFTNVFCKLGEDDTSDISLSTILSQLAGIIREYRVKIKTNNIEIIREIYNQVQLFLGYNFEYIVLKHAGILTSQCHGDDFNEIKKSIGLIASSFRELEATCKCLLSNAEETILLPRAIL